jgi:biopolymer transport protein ExbD/biopolymer transport protein TolR
MGVAVRNEGRKVNSNINVTPMVDVMLVLLIIFMVITPMLQQKVQIDMAQVANPTSMPDADKEDAIVVAVTRDGRIYLGQNRRKDRQNHLYPCRCPRPVQGGGRRH